MKKKGIRLLVVFVVLVLLVGGYFIISSMNKEREQQEAEEEYAEDGTLIYSMEFEDIANISFTYEGQTYGFSLKDDTWIYDGDENFPVNQSNLDNKALTLMEVYVDRELGLDGVELSDFGLDNPVTTVTVTDVDGNTQTYSMGERNNTASAYYMLDENTGKVYLRDGSFIVAFADGFTLYDVADLEDYPNISEETVSSVIIDGEKNIKGEVIGAIAAIDFNESIDYNATEEEKENYGLTNPSHRIEFTYTATVGGVSSEVTRVLLIGGAKDETQSYAMFEDSTEVSTILIEDLSFLTN